MSLNSDYADKKVLTEFLIQIALSLIDYDYNRRWQRSAPQSLWLGRMPACDT